jgi:hypothetical protein
MDLPALERTIDSLEKSLASLEFWLLAATALVVLGLVLECWHEIPAAIDELRRAWAWKSFLVIVGGVLITVGVAGELAVQFFASRKETNLRKANDAVFSILNGKAAEALERAAKADERASQNEKEAVRLSKIAEDERLARVKIEEDVTWRRLTKDQQIKMASRLKPFASGTALLQYNLNDLEADSFASDIASVLQQAKWKKVFEPLAVMKMREGPVSLGTNPPLERGVIIISTGDQTSHSASDEIRNILEGFGFDATRQPKDDPRPNSMVFILVEHRPEGPQGEAKLRHKADRINSVKGE